MTSQDKPVRAVLASADVSALVWVSSQAEKQITCMTNTKMTNMIQNDSVNSNVPANAHNDLPKLESVSVPFLAPSCGRYYST
jgi:hypothetical protein